MMTTMAQVIELRPGVPDWREPNEVIADAPLRIDDKPPGYCRHRKLRMDPVSKRVHCEGCEAEIPAFEALEILCEDFERHIAARDHAIRERTREELALADVQRQVRNAKAQLRRASR